METQYTKQKPPEALKLSASFNVENSCYQAIGTTEEVIPLIQKDDDPGIVKFIYYLFGNISDLIVFCESNYVCLFVSVMIPVYPDLYPRRGVSRIVFFRGVCGLKKNSGVRGVLGLPVFIIF